MTEAAPDGLLIVDKPAGWTSHDVVAKVRRLAGTRKVGHAGTLDPMATGVLVVGLRRATRLLTHITGADKEYEATIRLGVTTTTDDAEGEVTSARGAPGVGEDAVRAGVRELTGTIEQVPSTVSAIKVNGQRAYARARAGESVALAPRRVTVSRFEVRDVHRRRFAAPSGTNESGPDLSVLDVSVSVTCSSGTYVRALARDLGEALGVGGHLTALRRTRVGGYGLDRATPLADLVALVDGGGALPVLPMAAAARCAFAVRDLTDDEARALSYGRPIAASGREGVVAGIGPDGRLVALLDDGAGPPAEANRYARPVTVFAPA